MKSWIKVSAAFVVLCSALFAAGCATTPTTEWTNLYPSGKQPHREEAYYGPTDAYLSGLEMRLRSDGVVVWRERKKDK